MSHRKCVVLDMGSQYARVGFSGEPSPRAIVRSDLGEHLYRPRTQMSVYEWLEILQGFLVDIFSNHLLCRAKNYRLVIIEPLVAPDAFRQALALAAFRLGVLELSLCPAHLAALYSTGCLTGMVVDIGREETRVLAVSDGHPLFSTFRVDPLGTVTVARVVAGNAREPKRCAEETMVRECFVERSNKFSRDERREEAGAGDWRSFAPEALFSEGPDGRGLAALVLDCLEACPIDLRAKVAAHVLVIGGGSMLPGIRRRLEEEVRIAVGDTQGGAIDSPCQGSAGGARGALSACVSKHLWVPESAWPGSVAAWVGASVLASLPGRCAPLTPPGPAELRVNLPDFLVPPVLLRGETKPSPPQGKSMWQMNLDGVWLPANPDTDKNNRATRISKKNLLGTPAVAGIGTL